MVHKPVDELPIPDLKALFCALEDGRIGAVAEARRRFGLGLADAVAMVSRLEERKYDDPREPLVELAVIAVGAFSRAIADCLDYAPERYAETREGVMVVTSLFFSWSPGSMEALMTAFGADAASGHGQRLDAASANLEALRVLLGDEDVSRFKRVRAAGFRFYFVPHRWDGGEP